MFYFDNKLLKTFCWIFMMKSKKVTFHLRFATVYYSFRHGERAKRAWPSSKKKNHSHQNPLYALRILQNVWQLCQRFLQRQSDNLVVILLSTASI